MKKRVLSVILCTAVMLLSLSVLLVVSANPAMVISCDSAKANPGDRVDVDLKLQNNPGFMALNLAVLYDRENLELLNIENKLSGFVMSSDSSIVWDGGADCTDDCTLATFTFKVNETAKQGDYEIKVRFFEASNNNGDDVSAVTSSGKISVMPKQTDSMKIYAENVAATPGDTVSVDLAIQNNEGFMALNLAVLYDRENFELLNIENKLSNFVMSSDSSIVWDGGADCTDDCILATFTFKVNETAKQGDYEIKVRFFEASNYNGDDITAEAVSGKITVKEKASGDINSDGKIDVTDCVQILMYANGKLDLTAEQIKKADIDGNGSVEKADAEALAKQISGKTA